MTDKTETGYGNRKNPLITILLIPTTAERPGQALSLRALEPEFQSTKSWITEFLIQGVWRGVRSTAFLISFQVRTGLLGSGAPAREPDPAGTRPQLWVRDVGPGSALLKEA